MRVFVFFFIFAYNLFVINGVPYASVMKDEKIVKNQYGSRKVPLFDL